MAAARPLRARRAPALVPAAAAGRTLPRRHGAGRVDLLSRRQRTSSAPIRMKVLERTLGLWALRFLIAGLAITPLRRLGGHQPAALSPRDRPARLLLRGAASHRRTRLLDQGLDLAAIWADIVKRPYITVGMGAFLILVPLAVTSNNADDPAARRRPPGSGCIAGSIVGRRRGRRPFRHGGQGRGRPSR